MIHMYPPISPFTTAYPPLCQIYVGDLPLTVLRETLVDYFSRYGQVLDVKLGTNKYSKKYAFISFTNPESVERALQNANNTVIDDTLVRVDTVKNMKQISNEANLFFQNIPIEFTNDQIKGLFSKFGKVISSKLVANKSKSLGYGYVQFETKEAAEKCLKSDNELFIDGTPLNVTRFIPRNNRENIKNNLYVKNLPENKPTEDISQKIQEVFGELGQINSKLVAVDKRSNKPYAFVCFASSEAAERASKTLSGKPLFPVENEENLPEDEKMVINLVLGKHEKSDLLKRNQTNNNNIYTKNLRQGVTCEQLQTEFSKFGEILSVNIPQTAKPTVSAFICFKNSEDAKDAIAKSGTDTKILDLYDKGNIYITYHQSKDQRRDYLKVVMKSNPKRNLAPGEKPIAEGGMNLGFAGQTLAYPMNYNMPFMMPQNVYQQTPYQQPLMQNFQSNFPMGNMNMMQGQQNMNMNQNKNFNMGMGGMQRKNMMDQNPRKFQQQGGFQQGQMPSGNFQQRPQPQQFRQKRGGGYQKPSYNRPNQIQPQPPRNVSYNPAQPENNNNINNNYMNRPETQLTRNNLNNLPQQQPLAPVHPILKESIESFMKRELDYQRTILGTLLYPLVQKKVENIDFAPKITGMLIDFENFGVPDILEFIENDQSLDKVIEEAQTVIMSNKEGGEDQ